MNAYAQIAIKTATLLANGGNPAATWQSVAEAHFPPGSSSAKKGCPKAAFLGLCEDGYVKGVKPGNYTRSKKNKLYAIRALHFIKHKDSLAHNPKGLWLLVTDENIKYNSQMDVVCELYLAGLLDVNKFV